MKQPHDAHGNLLRAGDQVRILAVPNLSGTRPKQRTAMTAIFKHLVGKAKRITAFDERGNAEIVFRIQKGKEKGLHIVGIEPELLERQGASNIGYCGRAQARGTPTLGGPLRHALVSARRRPQRYADSRTEGNHHLRIITICLIIIISLCGTSRAGYGLEDVLDLKPVSRHLAQSKVAFLGKIIDFRLGEDKYPWPYLAVKVNVTEQFKGRVRKTITLKAPTWWCKENKIGIGSDRIFFCSKKKPEWTDACDIGTPDQKTLDILRGKTTDDHYHYKESRSRQYYLAGHLDFDAARYQEARKNLNEALAIDPTNDDAALMLRKLDEIEKKSDQSNGKLNGRGDR